MSTNGPPLPTVSTVDHVPLELPDLPADPLVSIVVTCYNRDGFIRDCLDSALGQSHEPFEVLVYDDGSTDGSVEIISQIADRDPRVKLIASPERRGHIPAINEAYSIASGSIVCPRQRRPVSTGQGRAGGKSISSRAPGWNRAPPRHLPC